MVMKCLIILGLTLALFVSGCVDPKSIEEFLEDEIVQKVIERDRVGLINETDEDLQAGNGRIIGLDFYKFYMVEVRNEHGEPFSPAAYRYISANGQISLNLADLGMSTTGVITNLNNNLTYVVYSATPLTGSMPLYDQATPPPPFGTPRTVSTNVNGILSPSLEAPDHFYYLDVSGLTSAGTMASPAFVPGTRAIRLTQGTTTYYFFHDVNTPASFRYLRVTIAGDPPPPPPEFDLNVSVTMFTLTDSSPIPTIVAPFSQADIENTSLNTRTISITNIILDNLENIEWRFNNNIIGTGSPFTLNFNDPSCYTNGLNAIGSHIITVTATTGSGAGTKYYSGTVMVTVNE